MNSFFIPVKVYMGYSSLHQTQETHGRVTTNLSSGGWGSLPPGPASNQLVGGGTYQTKEGPGHVTGNTQELVSSCQRYLGDIWAKPLW